MDLNRYDRKHTQQGGTGSLFDPVLHRNTLLTWLPDETLFSLCSRHHRLWGHAVSRHTTDVLFRGRGAGTLHDLPGSLDTFASQTDEYFGTSEALARERTLLRFYRPFLAGDKVAEATRTMRGSSVAHLKFRMGLLTSRFRANHPLKACCTCMQQDINEYGWAYWHLVHQYPGVWFCLRHQEPLCMSTVKSNGVERFLWQLPNWKRLKEHEQLASEGADHALRALATLITRLVNYDRTDGWLNAASIQAVLHVRLADKGWITQSGSVRVKQAVDDYLLFCSPLRNISELSDLPNDREAAMKQLGRLLRPLRSGTHPLRLLTAIQWLFDDADEFIAQHEALSTNSSDTPSNMLLTDNTTDSSKERIKATLMTLMGAGKSITGAAHELGITVATAMAWATEAHIVVGRRPKMVNPALRASLIRALRRGTSRRAVASEYNVSIPTVSRILHTEIGLHQEWITARAVNDKEVARAAWTALLNDSSAAGIKVMRAMNPALYAWLYRNDHEWLAAHSPHRHTAVTAPASSVRWDERDRTLSVAVQRAALSLSEDLNRKPLKLWQLYQAVPELKAKLSSLDRLPLTARAVNIALSRQESKTIAGNLFEKEL